MDQLEHVNSNDGSFLKIISLFWRINKKMISFISIENQVDFFLIYIFNQKSHFSQKVETKIENTLIILPSIRKIYFND